MSDVSFNDLVALDSLIKSEQDLVATYRTYCKKTQDAQLIILYQQICAEHQNNYNNLKTTLKNLG